MSGRKENKAQRNVGRPGVWEATGERAGPPECYFSWEIKKGSSSKLGFGERSEGT